MDDLLSQFRQAPRPEFAEELFEKINTEVAPRRTFKARKWSPLLIAASLVVMLVGAFSFPAVRTLAQDFLELFRVKHFAAISIDPARIEQLRDKKIDFKALLSDNAEALKEPAEPVTVDNPQAAAKLAGIPVRVPTALPFGMELSEIRVRGESVNRFTADTAKLKSLLDTLDITDVNIPQELNGAKVTVKVPATVVMRYTRDERNVVLIQSRGPEIDLPKGVNLAQLGEIGLRIAGMSPGEAASFAHSIDWHSTLVVPIPSDAGSFREVTVGGTTGLLITCKSSESNPGKPGARFRGRNSLLLWSEGGMVYGLSGDAASIDLVEMANSLNAPSK